VKNFKSGHFSVHHHGKEEEYQTFTPELINRSFVLEQQSTLTLLEEATRLLGRVNTI